MPETVTRLAEPFKMAQPSFLVLKLKSQEKKR
jgi:hypothetical protein